MSHEASSTAMGELLDEKEVAKLYAVAVTTLRNWRAKGEGPRYIKLGKRAVRYRRADLEAFIAGGGAVTGRYVPLGIPASGCGNLADAYRAGVRQPRHPAAGSARAGVLAALAHGRGLTSMDALREFGTSRLAADVHALRVMGWPIVSREVEVRKADGRFARVAEYRMVWAGAADGAGEE